MPCLLAQRLTPWARPLWCGEEHEACRRLCEIYDVALLQLGKMIVERCVRLTPQRASPGGETTLIHVRWRRLPQECRGCWEEAQEAERVEEPAQAPQSEEWWRRRCWGRSVEALVSEAARALSCSVSLEVKMQTRYGLSQGHWPEELAHALELQERCRWGRTAGVC